MAAFTNALTNITNAAANAAPLSISSADSIPTSLHTPTIRLIATDSLIIKLPILLACSPESLATFVIAITKAANAAANIPPWIMSSADSPETNLHTPTIRSMAIASLVIILPTLSMFSIASPLTSFPTTAMKAIKPTAIPARPIKPFLACSGVISPISFTTNANMSKVAPICNMLDFNPSMFNLPFSSFIDDLDINSIAIAKAAMMPARAAITPTAFQSFPTSSIVVNTYIAPTNIAIDIAIF